MTGFQELQEFQELQNEAAKVASDTYFRINTLQPSSGYPSFLAAASASFFRFRSIIQATRMQISYRTYIGPNIIAIDTASGVGAKNAAATKDQKKRISSGAAQKRHG